MADETTNWNLYSAMFALHSAGIDFDEPRRTEEDNGWILGRRRYVIVIYDTGKVQIAAAADRKVKNIFLSPGPLCYKDWFSREAALCSYYDEIIDTEM